MKRLIFCFDGTWNRLDAKHPTNVIHVAESIRPLTEKNVAQLIYYDEGVGTKKGEKLRGGLFGKGLLENIADAYRFLVFNYDPGDEVFIFGFSRGAYSARSFAGLILHSGVVSRQQVRRIPEAVARYQKRKKDDDHLSNELLKFRAECSQQVCVDEREYEWRCSQAKNNNAVPFNILRIKYIGVWDTVGALGIPKSLSVMSLVNRKYQFHDCNLSDFVTSARHAVAIDEKRKSFEPTLWRNVDELNNSLGYEPSSFDAPYQQQWFPGVHGSVGGGGDHRGLSDEALDWVLQGAVKAGLELYTGADSKIYNFKPNFRAPLKNIVPKGKFNPAGLAMKILPSRPRLPGPTLSHQVSISAKYRWHAMPEALPEGLYRPETLDLVAEVLSNAPEDDLADRAISEGAVPKEFVTEKVLKTHTVLKGESLSAIAEMYYGDKMLYEKIFQANVPMLTDPARIHPGQILLIPKA